MSGKTDQIPTQKKLKRIKNLERDNSNTPFIERWRCYLCLTVNEMSIDICAGCKLDYSKEANDPVNLLIVEKFQKPEQKTLSSFTVEKKSKSSKASFEIVHSKS